MVLLIHNFFFPSLRLFRNQCACSRLVCQSAYLLLMQLLFVIETDCWQFRLTFWKTSWKKKSSESRHTFDCTDKQTKDVVEQLVEWYGEGKNLGVIQLKIARRGMYKRKAEARSRNHCCRVKVIKYYIFWVCVCSLSFPACKAHAPDYIVICGLSGSTTFFHIIS